MSPKERRECLLEYYDSLRFIGTDDDHTFDPAIVGIGERCGQPPVVIYSRAKLIACFKEACGGTWEDAEEYVSFNIEGAWVGEDTPIILQDMIDDLD